MRLALIFVAAAAIAQPDGCRFDLAQRWNRFANDANTYVRAVSEGVVDVKLRARLDRDDEFLRVARANGGRGNPAPGAFSTFSVLLETKPSQAG